MSIYFKAHASPKPHSAPPTADFRSRCINIHSEFLNGTRGSDRACHSICRATQLPSVSTQKKRELVVTELSFSDTSDSRCAESKRCLTSQTESPARNKIPAAGSKRGRSNTGTAGRGESLDILGFCSSSRGGR